MADLLSLPIVDKATMLGGCVRLPITTDRDRLSGDLQQITPDAWGDAGRVGVHRAAHSLFLRGHAPAEGPRPIEDRSILERLPYFRSLVRELLPAKPLRALLAMLPPGAEIKPHVDSGPLLARTIRIHIPIETNDRVWMLCNGLAYRMKPGEVWALNNGTLHGVWNRHPTDSRVHLICDFQPTPLLEGMIRLGDSNQGIPIEEARMIEGAVADAES